MSAEYQIWAYDAFGARRALIPTDAISKLQYAIASNTVGALTMTVRRDAIPDGIIGRDTGLEVWRRPDGAASYTREAQGVWMVQSHTRGWSQGSGDYLRIKAVTLNDLLRRRYVLYYRDSIRARQGITPTAYADDVIKNVVNDNLGSLADNSDLWTLYVGLPTRRLDAYLTIDPSTGQGAAVTKRYSNRNVLSTIQELCRDSAAQGIYLYFDIVQDGSGLVFRTWTGQRGTDRTTGTGKLAVSLERGTLGDTVEVTEDYANVATLVVDGGAGQDSSRLYGYAFDATRVASSRYGLVELFIEDTSIDDVAALNAAARAELQGRRPAKTLSGNLLSVDGAVYGVDWGMGDKIIAEFETDVFTARVESVTVSLDKGQETVSAAIQGDVAS